MGAVIMDALVGLAIGLSIRGTKGSEYESL